MRFLLVGLLAAPVAAYQVDPETGFQVRDGYAVQTVASDLGEARFMVFGDDGTLYLSQPRAGRILSLKDADGDGSFETRATFVENQPNVHSMDVADGWVYFTSAQKGFAKRARDTTGDGVANEVEIVIAEGRADGIPAGGGHAFRGILVAPDRIYITVSDPGNITPDQDTDRKQIFTFSRDGSNRQTFATGIRNTEKLQFRIAADGGETDEVWGADHGSDWYGRPLGDTKESQPITDLIPPDELNHYVEGGFYGHPFFLGPRIPRLEYMDRPDFHELAEKTIPPAYNYPAHAAANGFTFLSSRAGEHFGPDYVGDLVQAFHGSWNRSDKSGYNVTRILFDAQTGEPYGHLVLVSCLDPNNPGKWLARPVDVAEAPDGSLIFSCNVTKRLFRITKKD
ncbi:MAG: PQQ-dependent sugar dehydrogenase [Phycisphaerae bacterium]